MKTILLKIAHWINERYGVSVDLESSFNFKGERFKIVEASLHRELGCIDEFNIKAHDISRWAKLKK